MMWYYLVSGLIIGAVPGLLIIAHAEYQKRVKTKIEKSNMRLYYIAYDYGKAGVEMIDGAYGHAGAAFNERDRLIQSKPYSVNNSHYVNEHNLIVVRIQTQVERIPG